MEKQDVCDWLRSYLKQRGRVDCEDVRDAARVAGYTRGELKEARQICSIKATSIVYWQLPEENT